MSATYTPAVDGAVVPIPILLFTLSTYSVPLSTLTSLWNVETPVTVKLSNSVRPVRLLPSPENEVAVRIPVTIAPSFVVSNFLSVFP